MDNIIFLEKNSPIQSEVLYIKNKKLIEKPIPEQIQNNEIEKPQMEKNFILKLKKGKNFLKC